MTVTYDREERGKANATGKANSSQDGKERQPIRLCSSNSFEFMCALRTRDGGTERFGTRLRNCKGIADPRSPPRESFQTPATSLSCEHPFQPVRHSISRYQRPYTVTQRPHGFFDYAANSPRFYRYRVIDQQYTKQSEIDQSRWWTKIVASLLYFLVLGIPA